MECNKMLKKLNRMLNICLNENYKKNYKRWKKSVDILSDMIIAMECRTPETLTETEKRRVLLLIAPKM